MKRPWIYFDNPILTATDNSYRMAARISTYHDSALDVAKTDPFILGLYNTYHPLHLDFMDRYANYVSQGGIQQGETLNLNQMIRLLSTSKIGYWDSSIQLIYPPDTPQYMALLPNGRRPFQTGTQLQRINAVKALSDAMGTDALLAAIKADVDNFHTNFYKANTTQKGSKSSTHAASDEVDIKRVAMCVGQYANLGALIQKYASDMGQAEPYFDLAAIRKAQQVIFTGIVKKLSTHTVMKHTFGAGDQLTLYNPGVTVLQFYLSAVKNAQPPVAPHTLPANTSNTIPVSVLGDIANTYLMVYNPDAINKGDFVVEMV